MQVAVGYADRVQLLPLRLSGSRTEVTAARGMPAPLFVLPNGAGIAYGEFHLDAQSLSWVSRHLSEIGDALTRGSAWVTLWDASSTRNCRPNGCSIWLEALPREDDELNIQRILSYVQRSYWKFTSDAQHTARAGAVEQVLRNGLARAATASLKGAYFSALRDVAITSPTVDWLAVSGAATKPYPD